MQVSTGTIYPSFEAARYLGVPATDLVELFGTPEQVAGVATAVRRGRADERKKAARRAAQRSRRANR